MTEQISMFELIDTENTFSEDRRIFREEVRHGSGFVDGKVRIREKALSLPKNEFIEALKKEYGVGGWSSKNGFVMHTNKGLSINWKEENEKVYSWTQVANEILDMINTNSY